MIRSHRCLIAAGAFSALTVASGATLPDPPAGPASALRAPANTITSGSSGGDSLDPVEVWPITPYSGRGVPECGDQTFSQSTSLTVENPSVWCGTLENSDETSVARTFVAETDIALQCVTVGVRGNAGGPTPIWATVYLGSPNDAFASLTPIGFGAIEVPDAGTGQLVTIPLDKGVFPETFIDAGDSYIVEVTSQSRMPSGSDAGGLLRFGFNNDGQSSPTYFRADSCSEFEFVDLADLGFPTRHLVLTVGAFSWSSNFGECEPLTIEDGSFETGALGDYTTVLNNFAGNVGTWGDEVAAIVSGPSDGVSPRTGSKMLRLTNDQNVVSQVVQAVPLGSLADLVDAGLLTANFGGYFSASNGVPAAGIYTMIRFYSSGSLSSQTGVVSQSRLLDASPGSWQKLDVETPIPAGARWMVVEAGFNNASIGSAAGYMDDAALCIARNCVYSSIGNPSFESVSLGSYSTVLNNFATSVGLWGAEAGSIVGGPTDNVSPLRGSQMLRLVNDGLSATQAVQVVDVRTISSLIDLGGMKANFGGYFNASDGVAAANSYAMVRFYGSGGFSNPIGITQTSKTLDALPGRWEWNATSKTVPVGTRWMVLEVGFTNSTIGGLAGCVDATLLCLNCDCERLTIKETGFETAAAGSYSTVLNNFATQQGIWGVESGAVVSGPVDGVWQHRGHNMLRLTDDGLSATQAVQVLNVSSMASIIDAGLLDATFMAHMNVSTGVTAATGSTTLRFYGAGGFSNPLTPITASRAFDSDPATWEAGAVRSTVPVGTKWIVTEVSFTNATIGSLAGFVDSTKLCLSRRALNLAGFRYNGMSGATLILDGDLIYIEPPVPLSTDYGVSIEFGTAVAGIASPETAWENLPGEHVIFRFANENEEERFEFEHVVENVTRLHTTYVEGPTSSDVYVFNAGQFVGLMEDVASGALDIEHQRMSPLPQGAPQPDIGVKIRLTCSSWRHYRIDAIAPIISFSVSSGETTLVGDTIILAKRPPHGAPPPGCILMLETNAASGLALSGNAAAAVGTGESRPFENEYQHLITQGVFVTTGGCLRCCPPQCLELFAGDFYGLGHASLRMVSDSGTEQAEVLFDLGGVQDVGMFFTDPRSFPIPHTEIASLIEIEVVAVGGGPAGRFFVDHCNGCPPPFDNGTNFAIGADFTGVGSETYTMEVWDGDTLVYEAPGMTGLAGYVSSLPDVFTKSGGKTPCGRKCWPDRDEIFIPATGQTFAMTEIRYVCEGLTGPAELLDSVRFRTAGMAELTFEDITTVLPDAPEPCAADLNQDGILNFFDVQLFLNWYASSNPSADLNGDGVLNFFDVQVFLNLYSSGCP